MAIKFDILVQNSKESKIQKKDLNQGQVGLINKNTKELQRITPYMKVVYFSKLTLRIRLIWIFLLNDVKQGTYSACVVSSYRLQYSSDLNVDHLRHW